MYFSKFLIAGISFLLIGTANGENPKRDFKKDTILDLHTIYHNPDLKVERVKDIKNLLENDYYYIIEQEGKVIAKKIRENNKEKTVAELVNIEDYPALKEFKRISFFKFDTTYTKCILGFDKKSLYRHSSEYKAVFVDLKHKKAEVLAQGAKVKEIDFSPDASKISYIDDNNLYYYDITSNKEIAVTTDGSYNKIINGHTDWVYEEEFAFTRAYVWSPDSKYISYLKFDESKVKEFFMTLWGELYPEAYKFKYPKAGEDNSKLSIHLYNLENASTKTIELPEDSIEYIPRIRFTPQNTGVLLYSLNRHQNDFNIWVVPTSTLKPYKIYSEQNPYYVEIDDNFHFFQDESKFIISSEKSGFRHLYLYDNKGKELEALTKGEYEVKSLYGVDEQNSKVYFQASYTAPYNKEVMRVGINGRGLKRLAIDVQQKGGVTNAVFNKDFSKMLLMHSKANSVPVYSMHYLGNSQEQLLNVLQANTTLEAAFDKYNFVDKEIATLSKEDLQKYLPYNTEVVDETERIGFQAAQASKDLGLNYWIMKPENMDPNKKYPLLMFLYGGPGSQQVLNQYAYTDYLWYQILVKKGYVVVCVDNRGTGGRGEEFKKCTYLQLGKYETQDQIAAAKYFSNLPYIDADRIGIWGWSYGGFMSSSCLYQGNDVFKMAIAVAPVTHWKYYDNVYTERFMRTPKENKYGYESNSPINMVDDLKGKYLLVHGTADDNVHVQNTIDLIAALQTAGKQFDMQIYPNKNHSIYGGKTREYLYTTLTEFILKNL